MSASVPEPSAVLEIPLYFSENRAVLVDPHGVPFSEVGQTFTSAVLDLGRRCGTGGDY